MGSLRAALPPTPDVPSPFEVELDNKKMVVHSTTAEHAKSGLKLATAEPSVPEMASPFSAETAVPPTKFVQADSNLKKVESEAAVVPVAKEMASPLSADMRKSAASVKSAPAKPLKGVVTTKGDASSESASSVLADLTNAIKAVKAADSRASVIEGLKENSSSDYKHLLNSLKATKHN